MQAGFDYFIISDHFLPGANHQQPGLKSNQLYWHGLDNGSNCLIIKVDIGYLWKFIQIPSKAFLVSHRLKWSRYESILYWHWHELGSVYLAAVKDDRRTQTIQNRTKVTLTFQTNTPCPFFRGNSKDKKHLLVNHVILSLICSFQRDIKYRFSDSRITAIAVHARFGKHFHRWIVKRWRNKCERGCMDHVGSSYNLPC